MRGHRTPFSVVRHRPLSMCDIALCRNPRSGATLRAITACDLSHASARTPHGLRACELCVLWLCAYALAMRALTRNVARVFTASETRAIDRRAIDQFSIPGIRLMHRAGKGGVRCFAFALGRRPQHQRCVRFWQQRRRRLRNRRLGPRCRFGRGGHSGGRSGEAGGRRFAGVSLRRVQVGGDRALRG